MSLHTPTILQLLRHLRQISLLLIPLTPGQVYAFPPYLPSATERSGDPRAQPYSPTVSQPSESTCPEAGTTFSSWSSFSTTLVIALAHKDSLLLVNRTCHCLRRLPRLVFGMLTPSTKRHPCALAVSLTWGGFTVSPFILFFHSSQTKAFHRQTVRRLVSSLVNGQPGLPRVGLLTGLAAWCAVLPISRRRMCLRRLASMTTDALSAVRLWLRTSTQTDLLAPYVRMNFYCFIGST